MSGNLGFPRAGFVPRYSTIDFFNDDPALSTNLQICLDPGDILCQSSAIDQTVSDLANAHDAWLGVDSGTGRDPTFVGTPGTLKQQHWEFPSNGLITFKTQPLVYRDFVDQGEFSSLAMMVRAEVDTSTLILTSSGQNNFATGGFILDRAGIAGSPLRFRARNSPATYIIQSSSIAFPIGRWVFVGVSLNEGVGANGLIFHVDETVDLLNGDFGGTNGNSFGRYIGGVATSGSPLSGDELKLGPVAVWDRALTQPELLRVKNYWQRRYY